MASVRLASISGFAVVEPIALNCVPCNLVVFGFWGSASVVSALIFSTAV